MGSRQESPDLDNLVEPIGRMNRSSLFESRISRPTYSTHTPPWDQIAPPCYAPPRWMSSFQEAHDLLYLKAASSNFYFDLTV